MVELLKVKAHVGIIGNELADLTANEYKNKAYWDPLKCKQWTHNTATSLVKDKMNRRRRENYSETCRHKCQQKTSSFFQFIKEPTHKFTEVSRDEKYTLLCASCVTGSHSGTL